MENKAKNKIIFITLMVWGIVLSALYGASVQYDGDNLQLLENAKIFLETGHLLPYGNVASSGVKIYTPGSFLSAAVALPMWVWNTPYSAIVFLGFTHFVALLLMLRVLSQIFDFKMVILYLIFFWCNPWQTSEVFLWNPGYLYFFTGLHFWSSYRLSKEQSLFWPSLWHVISIFGAMQSHSSFVILVLISLFLFWKKYIKFNRWGLVLGLGLSVLSLVPYFIERSRGTFSGVESATSTGSFLFRGLVYVYPMLKGVWYWIRHGSMAFPSHLLNDVGWSWLQEGMFKNLIKGLWTVVTLMMAFLTVVFSAKMNFEWVRQRGLTWNLFKFKKSSDTDWLTFYIYGAFWALVVVSALIPAEMSFWHVMLLFPISVLVPLMGVYRVWSGATGEEKWVPKILSGVLLYFSIFTVITAVESRKHKIPSNLHEMYQRHHVSAEQK